MDPSDATVYAHLNPLLVVVRFPEAVALHCCRCSSTVRIADDTPRAINTAIHEHGACDPT